LKQPAGETAKVIDIAGREGYSRLKLRLAKQSRLYDSGFISSAVR